MHRTNSAHNRTASGEIVTVGELAPGFYDVSLTVTDQDGLSDTDTGLVGAVGQPGDFDTDGDVDGSDLAVFSINFGYTENP